MLDIARRVEISLLILLLLSIPCNLNLVNSQDTVEVNSYNDYLTTVGHYVFGEVQNNGDVPIKNVVLEITFHFLSGESTTRTATATLPTILEGRRSPFSSVLQLSLDPRAINVTNVDVTLKDFEIDLVERPASLHIVSHQSINNTVIGLVENLGGEEALTTVVATFYDKNQSVLTTGLGKTIFLYPADTVSFDITYSRVYVTEEVKYYSLSAFSFNPEYVVQEEVVFAAMGEDGINDGFVYIVTIFIIMIVFSALVLIGAYVWGKLKDRKRIRRRPKKRKV